MQLRRIIAAFVLFGFGFYVAASAAATLPPSANAGIAWLQSQLNADGSLTNENLSVATSQQARSETATALAFAGTIPPSLTGGITADTGTDTQSLVRHIQALVQSGQDPTGQVQALLANQNGDGGFGLQPGDGSDPLNTAWALLGLRLANSTNATVLSNALQYLVGSVNSDGGYGFPDSASGSEVYITSYVLLAYQAYSQSYPLTQQISGARQWLVSQQAGGAYGDTLSNAIASLALSSTTTDASVYAGALSALDGAQLTDGSWGEDPYLTALAIRALVASANQAQAQTPPTIGAVTGSVLDISTHMPIGSAQIVLVGQSSATIGVASNGTFAQSNLIPGTYTAAVGAPGYTTLALQAFHVSAGSTTNLGTLMLTANPTTANIAGRVTDGSTGLPLAGAQVSVTGAVTASTTSGADGSYSLNGLAVGSVTLTVNLTGYSPSVVNATLGAGESLTFSPALYPSSSGGGPTSATLIGTVLDALTQAPVAGASVTLGTASGQSDGSGNFSIGDLTAGSFQATISAVGYSSVTLTGTLANGTNNAGTVYLSVIPPSSNVSSVSGTVTDASTGVPIAGASIQVQGSSLAAISAADGTYQINSVPGTQFSLAVSAPGYISKTGNISLAAPGPATANIALTPNAPPAATGGLLVKSVTASKQIYDPYDDIELQVELDNSSSADIGAILTADIIDQQGDVVQEVQAVHIGLSQTPADGMKVIPANGQFIQPFDFNLQAAQAGNYRVVVNATDLSGNVLAQGGTGISINAVEGIGGGIQMDPPITQAGSNQPISIGATLLNRGNLPLDAGTLKLTITLADTGVGAVPPVYAGVSTFSSNALLAAPHGEQFDSLGNLYVVSNTTASILKVAPDASVTLAAQLPANQSLGSGTFLRPVDIGIDANGEFWVLNNSQFLFKVGPGNTFTSIATEMATQRGLALDNSGNMFVTGTQGSDHVLAEVTPSGQTSILVRNGFSSPMSLTGDSGGNLFVSNFGDGTISKISPQGAITRFAGGLNNPQGLTTDAAGNLYVANSGTNSVVKISSDGTVSTLASGLSNPVDVQFDTSGNLYVADSGDNSIKVINPAGQVSNFAASAANNVQGMRFDSQGNLYLANADDNTLTRVSADGSVSVLSTALRGPRGLAVDGSGAVYVANSSTNTVSKTVGGVTTTFASGFNVPYGVTLDGSGDMFVTEFTGNRLTEVTSGGVQQTLMDSPIATPVQVSVGMDGTLLVANNSYISRLPLAGGATTVASNLGGIRGFAQLQNGALYYADGSFLYSISSSGTRSQVARLFGEQGGIATDGIANFYIADSNHNQIDQATLSGTVTAFSVLPGQPNSVVRDSAGNLYTVVGNTGVYKVSPNGVASLFATLTSDTHQLALDSTGGLLATNLNAGTITAIAVNGALSTLLTGLSGPSGVTVLPDGTLAVTENNMQRLRVFSRSGTVQQSIYGFSVPRDIAWDGSKLIFSDGLNHVYTLVAGQYPQLLATLPNGVDYLDLSNGNVYVANGGGNWVISPSGAVSKVFQPTGLPTFDSIALRGDGGFALGAGYQAVVFNATQQVTAAYTGFGQLSGIAIDAQGDVYAGDYQNDRIVKVLAGGLQSQPVPGLNNPPRALRIDGTGTLYVNNSFAVVRMNLAQGTSTQIAAVPVSNNSLRGLAFVGGQIYTTDAAAQMVRVASGTALTPYAVGLSSPAGLRFGPDGSLYIADTGNGSVMRYSSGALSMFASGLVGPESLAFDTLGNLFVGGSSGQVDEISPAGQVTNLGVDYDDGHREIAGLVVPPDGNPLIVMDTANSINRVELPQTQTPPVTGTVVYSTTMPSPALPVGGGSVAVDFGTWTPNVGGDYSVTITPVGSGITGSMSDTLHVGPYASGQVTPDRSIVPPGNQTIGLTVAVQGADFTSIAKVHPEALSLVVPSTSVPTAMGEDMAGDIYFLDNTATLRKRAPDGTSTVVATGLTLFKGQIPVDDQQNVYVVKQSGANYLIDTISPAGQVTTLASINQQPLTLAMNQDQRVYIETSTSILRVSQDGSVETLYQGLNGPSTGTVDGAGNYYLTQVINVNATPNSELLRLGTDGKLVTLSTIDVEGEGVGMAGDCSNNLFVGSFGGSLGGLGIDEEESLVEVVGSTGVPGLVFNGLTVKPPLSDMDFVVFDRFHSDILTWTDDNNGPINQLPVSCGAIDLEAHVVMPAGQTATGFNLAPEAAIAHADGSTEYVWDMQSVTASGQNIQFNTVLNGLRIGDTRPVAQSAFLVFKNSFVANDLTLPLQVPSAQVAPAAAMTVSTDAPSYPANTAVNISAGLTDSFSTPVSGNLDIQVLDASGNLVTDLGTQAASIPASGSQAYAATWDTGSVLNGSYTAEATLTAADGSVLVQGSTTFGIGVSSTAGGNNVLMVGVTTDKASYGPTDAVVIDDRLANATSNAIADGISFTTTVTNPDGSVRWTNTSTLAELVPAGLRDITFPLALANAPPGTYGVSLVASLNGVTLPAATATFTVQSSAGTAAGVTGTVSVAPAQAPLTSTVTLSGSLSDNGNAALSNATATLAVLDPVAGQLVFQSPVNVPSLGIGQSVPVQATWTAAGTVNQTYVAILMATVNGVTKTLAQANFKLLDPTTDLTGTLTATPAQVQLTTGLTLAGSVSNSGPAIAGVTATLSIQDPTGATVFTAPVNIGSLAQGQAGQVLANWLAAGPINETYTATLSATVGSYTKTLAQASFMVIPPPIKIAAGLAEGNHGRVLILTDDPAAYPGNQDPFGPNPAPGLAAQNQHLGAVIKAAGWSYTLVTNADDFATQFNTGGYEVYVILSEAVKLPESLQESLDQAVANGAGLIVAGNHDDRNNKLEDALGVHSTGKSLSATGIVLGTSALEASGGQVSFGIDGQPLSVNKASASVLGNFTLADGSTAPAVFSNAYGTGKAVYMAFDLTLEAAQTPGSFLDQLLTDTLGYVHPASLTPYTGRVIPLTLTVQNQGIATPAVASLTLPAGVSVIDPNGATVSGSSLSWSLSLAVGQTATETAWIKLPATAGSISVTAEVDSGAPPTLTPQATTSLLIGVQTKP